MKRPLLGIALGCGIMGCILAALLSSIVASDVVRCRSELRALPEPAGWRGFPILDNLGGYHVAGERGPCVGHGIQCGMRNAELRFEGVCPREGLSLRSWFDENGIYASASDIRLRASEGTFVASSLRGKEERYIGAFRPVTEVLEGDAATLAQTAVARAKSGLNAAFGSAFFLLIVALAVQACTALEKLSFD